MESPFVGTDVLRARTLTDHELRRSCTRVYRNVYVRRGVELSAQSRAVAAWLWSGKEAVVAGNSAAALLGAKWVDARAPAELITRSQTSAAVDHYPQRDAARR